MTKCEICQSCDVVRLFDKENFTIAKCINCGLVFLLPRPTFAQSKQFYDRIDYYRFWGDFSTGNLRNVEKIRRMTSERVLASLLKYVSPGRILDVGCAAGYFLDVAREWGWCVYGVEPCSELADVAKRKFGEHIFCGMFEDFNYKDNFFDAVIMYDSFEHILNPLGVLRKCWAIMKSGGIIGIITPNVNSLSARFMKQHWTHFKEEHLYYFSPKTVSSLLSNAGFELCEITPSVKALSIEYMNNQFSVFSTIFLTPLFNFLTAVLPSFISNRPFYVFTGNMTIIARKKA